MAAQDGTGQKQAVTIDQALLVPVAAAHAEGTPQVPSGFDARKWVYNPETGQFHKIMGRRSNYYLVNPTRYEDRLKERLVEDHNAPGGWAAVIIFGALYIWALAESSLLFEWIMGPITLLCLGAMVYHYNYRPPAEQDSKVGPPPPPRPGRETVEQQKVHGEGGLLGGDRLQQAARGGSLANEGARPLETYDD